MAFVPHFRLADERASSHYLVLSITAGGPSGPGGGPGPQLPKGWTWRQVMFVALGFAMTLPLFNYVKERLVSKLSDKPAASIAFAA
eukprot:scaffold4085_cov18-Tisochrysis_lutea.AAC.1